MISVHRAHVLNESILRSIIMDKEWTPLIWQQNFFLIRFNLYVLDMESIKTKFIEDDSVKQQQKMKHKPTGVYVNDPVRTMKSLI